MLLIGNSRYSDSVPDIPVLDEKSFDEEKAKEDIVLEFAGSELALHYTGSNANVLRNGTVIDEYDIVGLNGENPDRNHGSASLLPDGSLFSIRLGDRIAIAVEGVTDGESARAAAEKALSGVVDFERFEYCEVTETDPDSGDLSYDILWYNKVGDVTSFERARAHISEGKAITSVNMQYNLDLGMNEAPQDLSFESYLPRFENKLNEVYGDRMASHEPLSVTLTRINGELCVYVYFGVDINKDDGSVSTGERCMLAAPLDH